MKKILIGLIVVLTCAILIAQPIEETQDSINVIASTTWVASYAQIAGLNNVEVIAPGTMIHPPEYEIKVSDIQKIMKADYFIYAGYETMMKTITENVSPEDTIQIFISTDNYYDNIEAQARKIAKIANTEEACEKNLSKLKELIDTSKEKLKENGTSEISVCCHTFQQPLAIDLGLNILSTFGPSSLTVKQISEASKEKYPLVIDNVHNPIANVILDVSPDSKIVIWRNFPIEMENNALYNLIKANINTLL